MGHRLERSGTSRSRLVASLTLDDRLARAAPWLLGLVFLAAAGARMLPLAQGALWGSDSGEYYDLTRRLVETGRVSFEYDGWGIAYPYFPGMFVVIGAFHAVLGVPLLLALQVVIPVVAGALLPLGLALLAHRVTGDARVSLLSGAFLAVTAPHVLFTSHAMPGTLGHLFLLGTLYLVLESYETRRFAALLVPVVGALVVTHHLTTYFAIGIVAGGAFLREVGSGTTSRRRVAIEGAVVVLGVFATLLWWLGVAEPFREDIVGDAFDVNPWIVAALGTLSLAALPLLVALRRRLLRLEWRPRYPTARAGLVVGVGSYALFMGICIAFVYTRVPGTVIQITWTSILNLVPVYALLCFVLLGTGVLKFYRYGTFVTGWLGAITLSLLLAVLTENRVLFPYRHVDYWVEPLAIAGAAGAVALFDLLRDAAPPATRPTVRATGAALAALLLVVSAALTLPPREAYGGFEERMSDDEFAAVLWAKDHLPAGSVVAADHRVSSLLFGFAGMRATWDFTPLTYHAGSFEEARPELESVDIPAGNGQRIEYVFLSPEIREGVTLVQWEPSRPMSERAYLKFFEETERFECVYPATGCAPGAAPGVFFFRVRHG